MDGGLFQRQMGKGAFIFLQWCSNIHSGSFGACEMGLSSISSHACLIAQRDPALRGLGVRSESWAHCYTPRPICGLERHINLLERKRQ